MSVIEAAAMRCRTMADGSLRIECEVEPRHAQAAFALFGAPGTPMALAALKTAAQQEQEERPKGGPLAKWVAIRCMELNFQDWLADSFQRYWQDTAGTSPARAAEVVRRVCGVESRAEIDTDEAAQERFQQRIRGPWQKHCIATGATA